MTDQSPFPAAVLWDMDGTLIDSEPYWFDAERRLVAEFGNGEWPDALAHQMVGFDLLDSAAFLQTHGAVTLDAHEIVERLLGDVNKQLSEAVPWQPGARALLNELNAAGVPCALVTMSWRSFADAVLAHLPDSFVVTVAGDEVPEGRGKPDPYPYELAAAAIGVETARCVAIEDSATGVASAVAAGCRVLAVPNAYAPPEPHPAVVVIESLDQVSFHSLIKYVRLGQ